MKRSSSSRKHSIRPQITQMGADFHIARSHRRSPLREKVEDCLTRRSPSARRRSPRRLIPIASNVVRFGTDWVENLRTRPVIGRDVRCAVIAPSGRLRHQHQSRDGFDLIRPDGRAAGHACGFGFTRSSFIARVLAGLRWSVDERDRCDASFRRGSPQTAACGRKSRIGARQEKGLPVVL